MDQNQELAVAQLRESVQKLGGSTERCGDLTLMRFLIARSMDIEKAAKMFVQWQKWRASFVPLNYIAESEIPDELSAEKIYLQGPSRKGFPVMLVKVNKHFPAKDQLQFKSKNVFILGFVVVVYFIGKEIGNEKLIGILDLQQLSYKNVDARGLITGFQFLQAYYPERLAKCYLLHMPGFFVRVWRFVSRFLEKATLEKIVIVTSEEETREFKRDVGEDALPEEYGGKAKLMLLQDVVLTPLDD
ncbi:UNVERIFIED_CONTAM: putative SEC14-like protein 6 [Sesamum indicum]